MHDVEVVVGGRVSDIKRGQFLRCSRVIVSNISVMRQQTFVLRPVGATCGRLLKHNVVS